MLGRPPIFRRETHTADNTDQTVATDRSRLPGPNPTVDPVIIMRFGQLPTANCQLLYIKCLTDHDCSSQTLLQF